MDRGKQREQQVAASAVKDALRTLAADYQTAKIKQVAGFVPAGEFTECSDIIANVALLLARAKLNVCVIDLKVFYPTLYNSFGVEPNEKGQGLLALLSNLETAGFDVKNVVSPVKDEPRIYLLSPSPNDLFEEYYSASIEQVEKAIHILREVFDVLLVDIPNNPPLEFCLGGIKACNRGYFVASERIEALSNMIKLMRHADSVGIGVQKFTSVILQNVQNIQFDSAGLLKNDSIFRFAITAKLPLIKEVAECSNAGLIYVRDAALTKKQYVSGIENIANAIAGNDAYADAESARKTQRRVRNTVNEDESPNSPNSPNAPNAPNSPAPDTPDPDFDAPAAVKHTEHNGIARLIRRSTGEIIPINSQNFLIGREFGLNYTISDNELIGRRHCWIVSQNGEYYIVDNNSRNHVYLDGIVCLPSAPQKMAHGQCVSIANDEYDFYL